MPSGSHTRIEKVRASTAGYARYDLSVSSDDCMENVIAGTAVGILAMSDRCCGERAGAQVRVAVAVVLGGGVCLDVRVAVGVGVWDAVSGVAGCGVQFVFRIGFGESYYVVYYLEHS
jgi:hypothetical protein